MNKLLATTALVGVLAFAAPALAGHNVDVVLNGQLNLFSKTTAIGVDASGFIVDVSVGTIDVTAVGNLNETTAFGGGSVFEISVGSTHNSSGSSFVLSYVKDVSGNWYNGSVRTSLSVSGSAWSHSSTRDFSLTKTRTNRVFVGSLQANIGSPTTAIGVDASGVKVNVVVNKLTVTAVGNMNSTNLK